MRYYTYVLIERHYYAATKNRPAGCKKISSTVECIAENQAKLFEKIFQSHDVEKVESITIINVEDA